TIYRYKKENSTREQQAGRSLVRLHHLHPQKCVTRSLWERSESIMLDIDMNGKDAQALDAYSRSVMTAAERVGPAVVRIDLEHEGRRSGRANMPGEYGGVGSGVIFASHGLILTNALYLAKARGV